MKFKKPLPVFLILLTVSALARIIFLFHHDFWFDESISYLIAKLPPDKILQTAALENQAPLHPLLQHFLLILNPQPQFLRLISLLISLTGLYVFYKLSRQLVSRGPGILALLLYAVLPVQLYYATEARPYVLGILFSPLVVLTALNLWQENSLKNKLIFTLTAVISLYSLYYYLFLLLALNLYYFSIHKLRVPSVRVWIILQAIILFLFLPWFLFIIRINHSVPYHLPILTGIPATFYFLASGGSGIVSFTSYLYPPTPLIYRILLLTLAMVTLVFAFIGLLVRKTRLLLFTLIFIPLLAVSILSIFTPFLSPKNFLVISPFYYLAVSQGVFSLSPRIRYPIATLFLCLILAADLSLFTSTLRGPPISKSLAEIKSHSNKEIILHTSVLTYYPFELTAGGFTNILIGNNPLVVETQEYIGGIPRKTARKNLDKFWLVHYIDSAEIEVSLIDKNK